MNRERMIVIAWPAVITLALALLFFASSCDAPSSLDAAPKTVLPFHEAFDRDRVVEETETMERSADRDWWLNSGAAFVVEGGSGFTIRGELPEGDHWRTIYAKSNPVDTDGGRYPQNVFRLVGRIAVEQMREEAYVTVLADRPSESPNKNATNGVFLFGRYKDERTLYYGGVRADGHAVIKKKTNGVYETLAEVPVFPGSYDAASKATLIPLKRPFGLRLDIVTPDDRAVLLAFFLDRDADGRWEEVLSARDDGSSGAPAIWGAGYGGIRTDFIDAAFDDYRLLEVPREASSPHGRSLASEPLLSGIFIHRKSLAHFFEWVYT